MGIAIPQVITGDRASGAQVIDGSLKFDSAKISSLSRTLGSGNRKIFTHSCWAKRSTNGAAHHFLQSGSNYYRFQSSDEIIYYTSGSNAVYTTPKFRDNAGWYNVVLSVDTTQAIEANRIRLFVNGVQHTMAGGSQPSRNDNLDINNNAVHYIGSNANAEGYNGLMSQVYLIDGQALGPENFGFTDPLTNTWRPKKYTGEFNFTVGSTNYTNISTIALIGSSSWDSSYNDVSKIFDDSGTGVRTQAEVSNKGESFSITFNPAITLSNETVSIDTSSTYQGMFVTVDGSDGSRVSGSDSNVTTLTTGSLSGSLSKITVDNGTDTSGRPASIVRIRIGGSVLLDPITGVNGFYLPMDGNSPIGQDQSGNENDWTPVNFGGSTDITKATGARPILNTGGGGTVARPGVFGSDVSATYTTTSASNSGGKYYFSHDASAQPTFSFIRGATYIFDYSASTNHPLRFATAADAAGSTEYTDGTSISGNVIEFTVPHNAPDTLYYYCNVHNGMGNSISVTTDETKADPYAWKCTVAMPLIDYASGTRADFSHDLNCTTASKSTDYDAITDFANPGGMFYDKVAKFVGDGSNDRVRIPTGSFAMGTGDFTIEFWGHFTATGDQGNRNARILTPQSESGTYFQFLSSTSGAKVQFKSDITIPNSVCLDRTRHYVYQRTGTTGQLIVDGVLYDTGTDNANYPDVAYQIGRYDSSNGGASLYMSDLRVYTGIQKYSTTGKSIGDQLFIPASTSPNILPDTPSGVAIKSKLEKITDGSVSINRSSNEYLQAPDSTNFRLDGQYCIEFFLKLTEYSNDSVYVRTFVLDGPTGDGGSTNIHLNVNPSSGAMLLWSGSSELIGAQLHVTGNWHHICLTRDSSNKTRLFVDGVLSGSATITTDYDPNSGSPRPRLGALGNTGGTSGYYSNWRIIKGSIPTEYQTSTTTNFDRAFYPPTEPLTTTSQGATANDVKLLCCQSNTSATAVAVIPTGSITVNGDPLATNFNPFNTDINTVRGQETGYCTLNPLDSKSATITENNLKAQVDSDGANFVRGTIAVSSGKWYFEFTTTSSNNMALGVVDVEGTGNLSHSGSFYYYCNGGALYGASGAASPWGGSTLAVGDTLGVALDMDNGTLVYYKNGDLIGTAWSTNLSGKTVAPAIGNGGGSNNITRCNFGQKPFKFPPPDGFQPLNLANIRPETVIARPDQYFGLNLWTGNGQSSLVVGGGNYIITPNPKDNGSYSAREPYDMFDGSTSTYWQAAASNHRYQLMTFPTPKTGSKIELSVLASNGWDGFEINGTVPGNLPSTGSQSWYDITSHTGGSLSSIRIAYTSGNHTQLVYALRIDDTIVTNQVLGTDPYQFSPDLVWVKGRNATHYQSWIDTIRGGTKIIFSNTNNAEETQSAAITSFNSNGFSVSNWGAVNTDANSYVAWAWKAGGSEGTWNKDDVVYASAAAAGLTGITSPATLTAASIGTKQGFSIIRWNRGADHPSWSTGVIPHGLTQAPDLIITKNLGSSTGWMVFHSAKGTGRLYLNQTGTGDGSGYTTLPTATHFTVDSTSDCVTANDCMSYCWHDVPGLQKFGKYIGNDNADGPYVELGFRPSIIIIKRSDGGTDNWTLFDASRNTTNVMGKQLYPNLTAAEADATADNHARIDFLSNGVKLRGSHGSVNANNGTFIYMAWAEAPTVNLFGAQSNAR